MEWQLSASWLNEIPCKEEREDSQFKRDSAEAICQSNSFFAHCMQDIPHSVLQVTQGLTKAVGMFVNIML